MHAAARLIYSSWRFDHNTPLRRQLHWLKAREWIEFKLLVLVFKCVQGSARPCLADELVVRWFPSWMHTSLGIAIYAGRPLNSPTTVGDRSFRSLRHAYGTVFHIASPFLWVFKISSFFFFSFISVFFFVKCLRGDLSLLTIQSLVTKVKLSQWDALAGDLCTN